MDRHNAASPRQVAKAGIRENEEAAQRKEDLKTVISTPEGRRFIWRMLDHCGVFRSVFSPSAHIYYNSGKQDVGHFLQGEIGRDFPDLYQLMVKENGTDAQT